MAKEKLIQLLKESGAVKFGKFVLSSGISSNYYIDIKQASTNPTVLKEIAKEMSKFAENYDLIAGLELGAVPLIVALSLETGIPFVIIRKEEKEHGTGKMIEGEPVEDKKVLVVEDVTTTGTSVLKAINVLRKNGAILDKVVSVVDRESGAREKIEREGLKLISLISVKDLLE
ncbi:MAG: orotate phosphoribosyltransferase [Thermoplasmata archaeon]|nr:orotate phosphoribosyltransferase [Thermoplasmata archaeon]